MRRSHWTGSVSGLSKWSRQCSSHWSSPRIHSSQRKHSSAEPCSFSRCFLWHMYTCLHSERAGLLESTTKIPISGVLSRADRLTGYETDGLTYRACDQHLAHGNGTCLAPSQGERRLQPPVCIGRSYHEGPSDHRRFEAKQRGTCWMPNDCVRPSDDSRGQIVTGGTPSYGSLLLCSTQVCTADHSGTCEAPPWPVSVFVHTLCGGPARSIRASSLEFRAAGWGR